MAGLNFPNFGYRPTTQANFSRTQNENTGGGKTNEAEAKDNNKNNGSTGGVDNNDHAITIGEINGGYRDLKVQQFNNGVADNRKLY